MRNEEKYWEYIKEEIDAGVSWEIAIIKAHKRMVY
jgi:hypothetical protein